MLIGNGMMAKAFRNYESHDDIIVFASGVSNSKEDDENYFNREETLLKGVIKNNPEKLLIYFGTCSIYDDSVNKTCYVIHKTKMENFIKNNCTQFYIFRLPQVVGATKNKTLVNYLFTSILNNKKIDINKYSTRNLISVDDVYMVASYLVKNKLYLNEITNIATPNNVLILDIVKVVEKITGLTLRYNLINFGGPVFIDIEKIQSLNIGIDLLHPKYLESTLYSFYQDSGFDH